MRGRIGAAVVAALALVVLAGCIPPNPGPTGKYLGVQADLHPTVTPKTSPVTWGWAPPIDERYGGTLYAGTAIQQRDPRPALRSDGQEPLRLWVADPKDGATGRPAIIWVHGGGFAVGLDAMYGLANDEGKAYAQRGYVGFSVEYRIDTTLIGTGTATQRPPSLCQWVQDNVAPGDPTWEARHEQCQRNIEAAQHDVQAAVRWVRRHAVEYGVDPAKIAVGGFSAGAVTAANVAYRGDDVGTHAYSSVDVPTVSTSKVQAAFGASGCLSGVAEGAAADIGASDAPISLIHSRYDAAVPYACAALTVKTARAKGLTAELTSYCTEAGHAQDLYNAHQAATDTQWTTFLARELQLYTGMRPPSAAPTCPGT